MNPLPTRMILFACILATVLGAAGFLVHGRQEAARTRETEQKVAVSRAIQQLSEGQSQIARAWEHQSKQISAMQLYQQDTERRIANVNTATRETVYRYAPQSGVDPATLAALFRATGGAAPAPTGPPIVNVSIPDLSRDMAGVGNRTSEPIGPAAPPLPVPVEIVVRDTRTEDKSTSERTASTETKTETTTEKSATGTETALTTEKTETKETVKATSEIREKETVATAPAPDKFGVGVTLEGSPFASYDLANVPAGPRFLGLGDLGAGLFVTGKLNGGGFDGGPQVNWTKNRLFALLGYGVREQETVLGVGFKF